MTTYYTIAGALLAAAGAAAAIAVAAGWPANLVFGIIAALLAIAAVVMFALAGNLQNLLNIRSRDLTQAQTEFQDAVKKMQAACPDQCRVNTDLPTCGN